MAVTTLSLYSYGLWELKSSNTMNRNRKNTDRNVEAYRTIKCESSQTNFVEYGIRDVWKKCWCPLGTWRTAGNHFSIVESAEFYLFHWHRWNMLSPQGWCMPPTIIVRVDYLDRTEVHNSNWSLWCWEFLKLQLKISKIIKDLIK